MPTYLPSTPSGPDFRVNTTTAGTQHGSTITALADGGYVVAWAGSEAPGAAPYDIYAQRYAADGTAAGGEFRVNATTAGDQYGSTVTGLAGGGFVVSWISSGSDGPAIHARRYAADGTAAGGEFRVNAATGFHDVPTITALKDGGFVVSWMGQGIGSLDILARRYAADGTAAGGEFRVNTTEAGDQGAPKVTGLSDGGFVVSWTDPGSDGPDIHAQRYAADGAAAGAEFRVNTATAGDQHGPTVTALADGGFVVAWVGSGLPGATGFDVFARRFAADGTALGGEFRVNTDAHADQWAAADVTDLADGGFLVSWSGVGVDGVDIYAQRYTADGTAAGGEFRVNAAGAGYQYGPAVTGLASGGFAVAWSDETQVDAGVAAEVYARRFTLGEAAANAVSIEAATPSLPEGNAGATAFAFTVRLDLAADTARSVQWQVAGSGANPASAPDFVGGALPGGTVAFAPGETSKTITVAVAGDTAAEGPEGFAVLLSNPSPGLGIATAAAAATILEDDAAAVRGTDGDDVFAGTPGRFAYEGLQGHDVLDRSGTGFRGAAVAARADGSVLLTHGDDAASMRGVEEVRFADGRLVLDANDPAARVARLYEAALDRLPDQGGLNFWIDAVQNGEPLSSLASGFLSSPEFRARFGDFADNGAFVDRLYLNVLGRAGEADGRKFWVASLDGAAATRADVLAAFSESPENQAGTAALVQNGIWDRNEAAAEVARLYDTVFGRKADIQGLTFWKDALQSGAATAGQMADAFTGSAEFRAQYGALDNRGFAEALYVNSLDRPADPAGLDFWTGRLDAGAARSEVVLAFSESAEHAALTAPAIGGETPAEFGILFA